MINRKIIYSLFLVILSTGIIACDSNEEKLCDRKSFEGTWQGKFVTTAYRADTVQTETSYEAELDFQSDGSIILPGSFLGSASYDWFVQSDPPILLLQFDAASIDTSGIQVIGGQDFVYEIEGCNNSVKTLRETREATPADPNDRYVTTLVLSR